MPTVRVLYVHHAGIFGGASRSLLELVEGFPEGTVQPRLVTQRGNVARIFSERGVAVIDTRGISQFDHTRFGHYRGKRWLLLLREALYLPFTFLALLRARVKWPDVDLVHVNEIVAVPAILIARLLFRRPVVVHVRSVQHSQPGLRRRLVAWLLRSHADAVIAIDETVRRSLPDGIDAETVHNGHTPRTNTDGGGAPTPPKRPGVLRVAMVGAALGFKGVREFVEAARLCRDRGLAVEFLLVGAESQKKYNIFNNLLSSLGFGHDAGDDLRRLIASHGLEERVRLLPFTQNIDAAYRDMDVLCFPSHLDAVGRPVFEAAFWRVPSIVAVSHPQPDTMIDGQTGLCIEPGNPAALADAIARFCLTPGEVTRMGDAAHELALRNFDGRRNAARVLDIYHRVLRPAGSPAVKT